MSSKQEEGRLQERIQKLIKKRGGYIPNKSHGSMITVKGIADLRFTYKGLSLNWEVKTPEDRTNVSEAQGIHCRQTKKALGITAVIYDLTTAEHILNLIDLYAAETKSFYDWLKTKNIKEDWDDGTKY